MPKKVIGKAVYDVVTYDSNEPITSEILLNITDQKPGITLCIRSESGHEIRGGYFFHITNSPPKYGLKNFEGDFVDELDITKLISFINHVSGRIFSEEMLNYCQSFVNFRLD
jgi:hypothetical protein